MKYKAIEKAFFLERPNRFIAKVLLDGAEEMVHVKNTGRCRELLTKNAVVYLEDAGIERGNRKTRYSLVAVEKPIVRDGIVKTLLINMDSQAPNKVVAEALQNKSLLLPGLTEPILVKPEKSFGDSRFDFYVEGQAERAFIEVKGCTLEENGTAMFPDAPTQRGVKHIRGLQKAAAKGYRAYIIILIQMNEVFCFKPNDKTHAEFGSALREAKENGVDILAYDCAVLQDSIELGDPIKVLLSE